MAPGSRRFWFLLARVAITAGLIAWVAARADLQHVGAVVARASLPWLLLACGLSALNICVGTLRWCFILTALGVRVPLRRALALTWSGQFFNTFLPSGMAGDALRSAWTAPTTDPVRAAASVVLDRAAACVGLGVAVTVGLLGPGGAALPMRGAFFAAALGVGGGAALLLASPPALVRFLSRFSKKRARRLTGELTRRLTGPVAVVLSRSVGTAPRLAAVGLALLTEMIIVATGFSLARAAGVPLSWWATLAVVPAVMVTAYVPFAISGLGVRDAALVVLLGTVGVTANPAWAISLMFLIPAWVVGLLGGVVFLLRGQGAGLRLGRRTSPSLLAIPVAVSTTSGIVRPVAIVPQKACEKSR